MNANPPPRKLSAALSFAVLTSGLLAWSQETPPSVTTRPPSASASAASAPLPAYTNLPSALPPLDYRSSVALPEVAYTNLPPALPPMESGRSQSPALAGTSQLAAQPPPADSPPAPLLQWGPVQFQPYVNYRFSYGDGLRARSGESSKSVIQQLSPGILLLLGDQWSLNYTPTFSFYSSSDFRDKVDHSVSLSGGTSYEDWTFRLSQSYARSSSPLVETEAQTDQESFSTSLGAGYSLNSKVSFDFGLSQNLRFTDGTADNQQLTDSKDWGTMNWVNYHIAPPLSVGVGAGGGYVEVSTGSDMTYQQLQGRVSWVVVERLSLSANAGVDFRQFRDSDASSVANPIFGLSAQYQLFEPTSLFINAGHSVSASYYSDQLTETTSVSVGVNQRLLGKLSLNVSGSYGTTTYSRTSSSATTGSVGDYDYTSFNVRLSTRFLKRATAGAFYQASYRNESGANSDDYTTTQVGFDLGYRF